MGMPPLASSLCGTRRGQLALKGFEQALVTLDDGSDACSIRVPLRPRIWPMWRVCACPSIWQQYVSKHVEIRATVFGHTVLAAEIHSQQSEKSATTGAITISSIPPTCRMPCRKVQIRCIKLLQAFGLFYGAIDLIRTVDGTYVFLEMNPFGQWAWVQDLCGLPLAEAHCRLFHAHGWQLSLRLLKRCNGL